jgi:ubiquinone biosynthesis protein
MLRVAFCAGEVGVAHAVSPRMGARLAAIRAQDLGPSFVKLCQFASTRADVLPEEYCRAFAELRDDARKDSAEDIRAAVVRRLGVRDLESVFCEFDPEPLASASIAQVHRARLAENGREVAVKVLKAGVRESIENDLRIAKSLVGLLPKDGSSSQLERALSQYSSVLRRETDFAAEAKSGLVARRAVMSSLSGEVVVPEPLSWRDGVLVMEYVPSVSVSESGDLERMTGLIMESILLLVASGDWFHQDPHQGNLGVSLDEFGNERLVLYDFGNVSRLGPKTIDGLIAVTFAFLRDDRAAIAESLARYGLVERGDGPGAALALDTMIEQGMEYVRSMNIRSFDASAIDKEAAHGIRLSPEVQNVMRAVVMAEGVCKSVYGGFDLRAAIDQFLAVHSMGIAAEKAARDWDGLRYRYGGRSRHRP